MKKLNYLFILITLLFSFTLTSCSNDDDEEDDPSVKTMLTANTWQGSKFLSDGDDVTNDIQFKKVTLKLNSDNTYSFKNDIQENKGKWALSSNDQKIIFDDDDTMDIVSLSKSNLTLRQTEIDAGESHTIEMSFTR